ncbi:hypothetical protein [Kitasatospora kazusensis]
MAQSDPRSDVARLTATQAKTLQAQIDSQLKKTPGGTQVSANEISWQNGNIIMSFPLPSQRTAPETSPKLVSTAKGNGVSPRGTGTCYDSGTCQYQKCPYGFHDQWYCLYQDGDYGGRRLQWKDHYSYLKQLSEWDFDYKASGWVNTSMSTTVEVFGPGDERLWVEPSRDNFFSDPTHSAYVGDYANDKATSFEAN